MTGLERSLVAAEVAAAMGGTLINGTGHEADPVMGFSIDSRTLRAGELFFAIRGTRFDGHAFTGAAVQAGACGVVVSEPSAIPAAFGPGRRAPFIVRVDDTIEALQRLARYIRRESGTRVVAVTGSVGKTTTKEVAAEFLSARYRVFRNRGNLNNHIGLPLSLLELRSRPDVAVVELGMSHAGEIRLLTRIAEPGVRVWTNVAEVHAAFFPSLEAIADAKAEILEGAGSSDVLIASADDPLIAPRVRTFPGRTLPFGFGPAARVRGRDVDDRGLAGTRALVDTPAGSAVFDVPLAGRHQLANVLAAAAVALTFDIPLAEIVERAAALRSAPRRGEIHRLAKGVTLVDDSYNANPRAVEAALAVLAEERRFRRRVAFLGEMLELGDQAVPLHERTGRAAAALDLLVTIGGEAARRLGEAAVAAGLAGHAWRHFETSEQAADAAVRLVEADDVVLVKGSRSVRTDLVADRLRAELG